ncbi:DUF3969 family protein [Priestia sp. FSL P4-0332]|uniref:DUF3969 family protein n=1 Tax=Priestia sp. FSL P4-0332 TaxID=2921634 RepID=UPI0030F929F3
MIIELFHSRKVRKDFAVNTIGVITSLQEGLITIEEAEKMIFSPRTMNLVKTKGASEELLNILHLGTELEDVESLIPHELKSSLEEIKIQCLNLLKNRAENKINDHIYE